jgi:adenine-specific DNA-methyltransferase
MDIDGKSLDITQDNLAKLKQLFPNLVKEGEIDLNEFRATFGQEPTSQEERYGLSWTGKYDAFKQVQEQTTHTLNPDRDNSIEFDQTENIFIEGENLDALKILQRPYYGKVKMIYIDPPYNTGNDHFIYPDNFAEDRDEYLQRAGEKDRNGDINKADLFRKNTRENGHFHSTWLSMMYPRLYLARNLLREDGVIFVSIDDNEVANLRLLMDHIFGEENFVAQLIWKSRQFSDARAITHISTDHEYILVYTRQSEFSFRGVERDEAKFNNPDHDPRGPWMSRSLLGLATIEQRPNLHYSIIDPKTGISYSPPANTGWRYAKERMQFLIDNDQIIFPRKPDGRPREKKFRADLVNEYTSFPSVVDDVFTAQGTAEIRGFFGFQVFDFPKPSELIRRFVEQIASEDDIIFDFFAGSATTAHAVLDLNKKDGGNRKFICMQFPEKTPEKSKARNAGYNTIADIGRARIRKVIEQMNGERAAQLPLGDRPTLGFRAFKLAPSNFKIWRSDLKTGAEILAQLEFHIDPTLNGNEEYMLWELLLKAGYPLSTKVEMRQIEGVTIYDIEDGQVMVALQAINPAVIEAVRQTKPQTFICLDKLFNEDAQLKTNTALQMKENDIAFKAI